MERISRFRPTSAGLHSPHPVITTDRFTSLSLRRPRKARPRRGALKGPADAVARCHRNGKTIIYISALALNFPTSLQPPPVQAVSHCRDRTQPEVNRRLTVQSVTEGSCKDRTDIRKYANILVL